MTAEQRPHLAELACDAARYYRRIHRAWARTMAVTAHIARQTTAHEECAAQLLRIDAIHIDIKAPIR